MSFSVGDDLLYVSGAPLRARPLGNLAASLMGVAALVVLTGSLAFMRVPQDPAATAIDAPPAPIVSRAAPAAAPERAAAFALEAPELGEHKISFDPPLKSGGRQEVHSFGAFDTGKPFLRLDILQPAGDKIGNSDFFLDVARHAAQAGLAVARIGQPSPLVTRAGAFEAAEIRLSLRDGGVAAAAVGERSCLAVRLVNATLSLEVAGVACGTGAKPVDRRAMGCLLDRMYYLPAGDNKALAHAFPKLEGQSCLAAPPAETETARPAAKKRAPARH